MLKLLCSLYVVTNDASHTVVTNVKMNEASMFTVSSNQLYKPYIVVTPMYKKWLPLDLICSVK